MINVQGLSKSFQGKPILKNLSFSINKGETICIIGPSGSGKSTLLRCLNFLEQPEKGTIQIEQLKINAETITPKQIALLRQQSAMIFQEFNLFLNKNVLENVMLPLSLSRKKTAAEAKQIAQQCLERVGMSDYLTRYPATLSGGQKQRVAIARSIAVEPQVLLFDEPTSALDPQWVQGILSIIEQLAQQNFTIIIVTHDMSFARRIADRIIFMDEGEIIEIGQDIISHPQNERTKQFLHSMISDKGCE